MYSNVINKMLQCWEYLVIHVFLPYTIWHFSLLVLSCGLYAVKFCYDSNHSCLIIFTGDVTNPHFFYLSYKWLYLSLFFISNLFCVPSICLSEPFIVLSVVVYLWDFMFFTGILILVYDSRNTVSTVTPVSEVVFLLSAWSDLINVMCNMFSSTGSLSLMPSFLVESPLAVCEL